MVVPPMHQRQVVAAFSVLLIVLIGMSPPQRIGDSREYLAMAMNLARLRPPALSRADAARLEQDFESLHFSGQSLTFHRQLRDASGRQDFFHFWFYPALAVPGIWLTTLTGLHPNYAFAALNALLFLGAAWIVATRMAWWLTALVFCSPVLWWIDKSHTEVFTFSLLAVAMVLLRDAPWWSMICLAAAATQNPPLAALLLCAAVLTFLRPDASGWRSSRVWKGAFLAALIALIHPLYYGWRWGIPTPQLLQGTHLRVPTIQEAGAVLWDPNIGLLVHAPLLVLTLVAVLLAVGVRARRRLNEREVWLGVAGAGIFLLSFAQTTNANNGATPGMSRYALWLIPLAIPVLQRVEAVISPVSRRWFVALALASSAWSVVAFQPQRPENYLTPTRAASILWTRWPWLDNPLPEIFAERLSGREPARIPVGTPDCAKVLTIEGDWPVPCGPRQQAPPACRKPGALCYANRGKGGYEFVRVMSPARYTFEREGIWTWDPESGPGISRILERLQTQSLLETRVGAPGGMLRATYGTSWVYSLQSDRELFVYMRDATQGAHLTLRLPGTMTGSLIDPDSGEEIQSLRIETQPWDITRLQLPARRGIALVLTQDR